MTGIQTQVFAIRLVFQTLQRNQVSQRKMPRSSDSTWFRKRISSLLCISPVVLSFLFPLKTLAATFSGIYVLGDSLSDTGNVFNESKKLNSTNPEIPVIPPPSLGYFNGRFSHGLNWIDYLSKDLGLTPVLFTNLQNGANPSQGINFAFGGATTGTENTIFPILPGLQQEVGAFTSLLPPTKADPDALYIVWAGGNDYLPTMSAFKPYTTPDTTLANISGVVKTLAGVGAKNILVANLPDLGKVPLTSKTALSQPLSALTAAHNAGLSQKLDLLSEELGSSVDLISLDVYSLAERVVANPASFGFTNVTDGCLLVGCTNPDKYLFWDQNHLTTAGNRLVADLAISVLNERQPQERVPEPSTAAGIFAFGVLGTISVWKRKRQKANSALTQVVTH